MGSLGDGLEIGDVVAGVADALNVDGLGLVIDGSDQVLGLVPDHELGVDSETREEDLELVVGAAVKVGCGDDVVANLGESGDGNELGRLAGSCRESGNTALQGCDSLLKYIDCGAVVGRKCISIKGFCCYGRFRVSLTS